MNKQTLQTILKMVGIRHTSLMEFWADLMNFTNGRAAGWLVENGYKDMKQLTPFLRPNQIAVMDGPG